MRALLDTHTFLWFLGDAPQLSEPARRAIRDNRNVLFLSAVSALEIAIKSQTRRFGWVITDPERYIPAKMAAHDLRPLPVEVAHALRVAALPLHHADPFDRLLIAQAQVERIPILTCDREFSKYDVEVLW
jgi:PIN domain nuclease of toxin-antitoxin system